MWTRAELKEKAKATLKMNYWKTVLVALLVMVLAGGISATGAAGGSSAAGNGTKATGSEPEVTYYIDDQEVAPEEFEELINNLEAAENGEISAGELLDSVNEIGTSEETIPIDGGFIAVALGAILVVVLAMIALFIVFDALIINPFLVGTDRFFVQNLNQPAEVKEVAYAFDHNYREVVKTMFMRELYILLWCLLLIIPGIVKAYEYRMIPYLLADDPTMTKERAFAESKRMMNGNKLRAFVLDLSFIGWNLLSVLTLGLLSIFYVGPYQLMTNAALYESLRYETPALEQGAPDYGIPAPQQATGNVPVPPFAAADAPAPVWDDEPSDVADGTTEA